MLFKHASFRIEIEALRLTGHYILVKKVIRTATLTIEITED